MFFTSPFTRAIPYRESTSQIASQSCGLLHTVFPPSFQFPSPRGFYPSGLSDSPLFGRSSPFFPPSRSSPVFSPPDGRQFFFFPRFNFWFVFQEVRALRSPLDFLPDSRLLPFFFQESGNRPRLVSLYFSLSVGSPFSPFPLFNCFPLPREEISFLSARHQPAFLSPAPVRVLSPLCQD